MTEMNQNLCALRIMSRGFVDLSDMMAGSYSISYKMWKWPKKLFSA